MTDPHPTKEDVLGHLPQDLLDILKTQVDAQAVQAAAAHDLGADGRFFDGYLVLAEDRLGRLRAGRRALDESVAGPGRPD